MNKPAFPITLIRFSVLSKRIAGQVSQSDVDKKDQMGIGKKL